MLILGSRFVSLSARADPAFKHPPPRWFSELVILGTYSLFELRYKPDGAVAGAYRHTDPQLIEACRKDFEGLYAAGEDLASFHAREIEHVLLARCSGDAR
ncbi:DUF6879 family protein [Streptomyces sp. NPDC055214]